MLACTALVGCSDDDVLNNAEMGNQQAEKMRAYMTFSIASSTNSSRGATNSGTTTGDSDGNQEHSGHENAGTDAENKINEVLIAFYNTEGGDGFSGLYTMNTDGDASTEELTFNSYSTKLVKNDDGSYGLEKPFALNSLGMYKALFIINPASAIKSKEQNAAKTSEGIKGFYEWVTTNAASSVAEIIGEDKDNFMMANRKEVTINVTEDNNDPTTPAYYTDGGNTEAPIEVERVVSKITFRPKKLTDTNMPAKLGTEDNDGTNVYKIQETKYNYKIVKSNFWFLNEDGIYNYLTNLYKAEDPDGKVYWVYVDDKGNTTRYVIDTDFKGSPDDKRGEEKNSEGDGMYEGELQGSEKVKAEVVESTTYQGTLVYVGTKVESDEAPENYYVQLKRYAIVNKNNQVYYVRHTSPTPASATKEDVWGIVGLKNYLIEPNTAAKSGLTFASPLAWPTGSDAASTYFNDDFVTVTNYLETTNPAQLYFKNFSATDESSVNATVTPNGTEYSNEDPKATGKGHGDYNTVGTLMDYVLENSILADNQNALTSTGVIFEAQIYNSTGAVVDHMLGWNGSYYPSFLALQEATMSEGSTDITTSPFWKYTDEDYKNMSVEQKKTLATTLANEGVTLYQDGKCYYFSAEIKHFENNNDAKGVMEYAIMRNNIYSLSVESVNNFGFSSIDLQSGVLNDSNTEQEKVYLTMKAKILPWIVRFNNIEF